MKLGLIGPPDAGKDFLADYLVQSKGFKRLAFADKIKEMYYAATGYTEELFKSARGKPVEQEIRDGLWKYSSKIKEKHGVDYFIKPIIEDISRHDGNTVVTDVRTVFEIRYMVGIGAELVVIYRNYNDLHSKDGQYIPGTEVPLSHLRHSYKLFWNDPSASKDEIYNDFNDLLNELQGE